MELLQLKYFCDAAETENFSKTAKKFLVPTSNISQSIKRLERELGTELFDHSSNKISLNSSGRLFYENASRSLALLEGARKQLSENSDELQGDIHLVCLSNRRKLTNAIEAFLKKYPKVNFIINHSLENDREIDLIISDGFPREYSRMEVLVDEEICLAVNRNHHFAEREHVNTSELEGERFITMTPNSSLYKITVRACNEAGFVPNIVIQTDDPYYLRKYIELGLGIAFVPKVSWEGLFSKDILLKRTDGVRRKTYAFLPKRSFTKRSVEVFLSFLQNEVKDS